MTYDTQNQWDIRNWGQLVKSFLTRIWPYCMLLLILVVVLQSLGLARMSGKMNPQREHASQRLGWRSLQVDPLDQNGLSLWNPDPFHEDFFQRPFDANTWDPFQEMQRMQEYIDSMFGDAFGRFSRSPNFGGLFNSGSFSPRIDIKDQGDNLVVIVDLPGIEDHNVDITCTEQELKISGTMEQLREDRDSSSLLRQERRSGRFSRSIPLPVSVQPEKMETNFSKGVVTVTLPKADF